MATTRDDMIAKLQAPAARTEAGARRGTGIARQRTRRAGSASIRHHRRSEAMSASPGDPRPVFDLIVPRARDLCNGTAPRSPVRRGTDPLARGDGSATTRRVREAVETMFPMAPSREWPVGRAIIDDEIIHISDLDSEPRLNSSHAGHHGKVARWLYRWCWRRCHRGTPRQPRSAAASPTARSNC